MISKSTEQTQKIAEDFLKKDLKTNLVFLIGNLGSGKTQFVKGVAKALEIKENITSPTFVLIREYQNKNTKFQIPITNQIPNLAYRQAGFKSQTKQNTNIKKLIHADLYRLKKIDDFTKNQILEYVDDKSNLVFIEWPETIKTYFSNYQEIEFKHINENTRRINFKF